MEGGGKAPPMEDDWPTSPEEYQLVKKIGHGAFAKVYVAKCLTKNVDCAIKVMDLEKVTSNLDHLRQEVMTMKLCRHKNVLPLYTSFNVKRELWLVMPYMDKGSMHEAMRQLKKAGKCAELNEEWIAAVLKEVCQGLVYLHKSGWVHRDIKAGNILINSAGEVMLSDFGVAGILMNPDPLNQDNNRNTFVGTPCWMAPEVMKQSSGYTEKADIWSLGITALELAKSYAPYAKERTMKVLLRTLQEPPPTLKTYVMCRERANVLSITPTVC
jgi:serine/threonine-protein kinase OSR1/STK39